MRGVFLGAILLGIVVGGIVAGVRVAGRDSTGAASPSATASATGSATAAVTANTSSAESVAQSFARAWSAGDIAVLHRLLSRDAQVRYPQAEFINEYNAFESELTVTSVEASITGVEGSTARMSVHLETGYFGPFDYTTALNLVDQQGTWAVAWDRTAIHADLSGLRTFESVIERPRRGAILDRDGEVLASSAQTTMVGLNRAIISDAAAVRAALVGFGFDAAAVEAAFASSIPENQRVAVGAVPAGREDDALLLPNTDAGILIYITEQRVHPLGAAAAHVVGYTRELTAEELDARTGTGARAGDRVGASGLEAGLEERLAGTPGAELRLVGPDGTIVRVIASIPFVPGEDVRTTLDAGTLRATQERLGSRVGAAVVIDPRTNAVLALNSSPSYDPDAFERGDADAIAAINAAEHAPLLNRATFGLYSAGSTFKLITGAAGLADGGYSTSDTIFCGATWDGIDPPRRNWEGAQGPLTIAQGLMRSCNPVFYEIGLTLYNDTDGALSAMARAFGFGSESGIVGIFDEAGLVPDAEWKRSARGEAWFPGDEVNLAIGQGDLLVTPLQLANAYSAFTAGRLRAPIIIEGAEAADRGELPLSAEQRAHLLQGLKLVTGASGTANSAFWNLGFTDFAGKSGTAEDSGLQQHVLFAAFAPADAPAALAAVVLDDGQSGSLEAGPIARDIILTALGRR
jgi:penicillin-binding protein 2